MTVAAVAVVLVSGACGSDSQPQKQQGDGKASTKAHGKPLDLEVFDWRSATIPGALCRHRGSIRLQDGNATSVSSTFDGPEPNMPQDVSAFTQEVVYGDLTGDGRWEAALPVICANHGSTAAGQRAMGVMVFDGAAGRLSLLGTLEGRQPRLGEPPNGLRVEKIDRGTVTATEMFYGSADPNCCPTGLADDTWTYTHGKLVPADSRVRTVPSPAP